MLVHAADISACCTSQPARRSCMDAPPSQPAAEHAPAHQGPRKLLIQVKQLQGGRGQLPQRRREHRGRQRREGHLQRGAPQRQLSPAGAASASGVAPSQQAAPQGCHLGQEAEVQLEKGVDKEAGDVAGQVWVLLRGSGQQRSNDGAAPTAWLPLWVPRPG